MTTKTKESVTHQIRTFYANTGRVPVSKDYRENYHGTGLPHWQTVKNHFPDERYDLIVKKMLGFKSFDELLKEFLQTKSSNVLYVSAENFLPSGYWASPARVTRWLSSNEGNVLCGFRIKMYIGRTRGHGHLFQLTRVPSIQSYVVENQGCVVV